jgi:thiol-disulfide isomerase/thioredoxin
MSKNSLRRHKGANESRRARFGKVIIRYLLFDEAMPFSSSSCLRGENSILLPDHDCQCSGPTGDFLVLVAERSVAFGLRSASTSQIICMKKLLLLWLALCFGSAAIAADGLVNGHPPDLRTLAIGDRAPDFNLLGIDGKNHTLVDYTGGKITMVLFTSNHCPTSHGIEKRLQRFWDEYRPKGLKLVAINPNHPDGLSPDELGFGEFGDSFAEMKPYAEKNQWTFDYLYDGDQQLTARAYGCLATPHVFVFDHELKLRYSGRFDDSRFFDDSTVKVKDAQLAVDAILAGQPVPVAITKPHGCSTKWREKKSAHDAKVAAWAATPVHVDIIDAAGVATLRANSSNKLRMINVWATWCAPCVQEFPDLVATARQFGMRDFELVTISLDQATDLARAQEFLSKQGAGMNKRVEASVMKEGRSTNSYLFSGTTDELIAVLDQNMPGPIPHTIVVAPGGEIIWRRNGVIDRAAAVSAILDRLNRFYSPATTK